MSTGKKFTLMLLSERTGKHSSVKMSSFILFLIIAFFVCLLPCGAFFSVYKYLHLIPENKSYKGKIEILESDLGKLRKENREAFLYKQWADGIIFRRLNYEDITGKGNNSISKDTLYGEIPDESSKPSYSVIDIDDFDVRRINLELDFEFSFKLVNRLHGRKNLSGYVYLVATNSEVQPEIYSSWPQVEILSGMPKDYKKGNKFSIRYLKNIKGRINQPDIGPKFNRVDLIAYAEDGNIMMKKGFYIERLLKQGPYE